MTTDDITITVTVDVSESNPVLELPVEKHTLAAVRFETSAKVGGHRPSLRLGCYEEAIRRLRGSWPALALWLFLCNSSWQPKNRIVLHRRLYRGLEAAKTVLPSGARSAESQLEAGEQIRFFGVVGVPPTEVAIAISVIESEPESFLVASPSGAEVPLEPDIATAWQAGCLHDLKTWARLAESLSKRGAAVLRPFGYFDDVEVGVDLLLDPALLPRIIGAE
jgi:hypothetical protein